MTSSNCTSSFAAQCTLILILPHGLRQLCLRLFSPVYLNPNFALWPQAIVLQVVQPSVLYSKFCLVASGNHASGCAARCTLIQILPDCLRQLCFRLRSPVYFIPNFFLVASGSCGSGCAAQCTLIQVLPYDFRQLGLGLSTASQGLQF